MKLTEIISLFFGTFCASRDTFGMIEIFDFIWNTVIHGNSFIRFYLHLVLDILNDIEIRREDIESRLVTAIGKVNTEYKKIC